MVGSGDINTLSASHDRIKYYNEWHPKKLELCTHTETVMTVTVPFEMNNWLQHTSFPIKIEENGSFLFIVSGS